MPLRPYFFLLILLMPQFLVAQWTTALGINMGRNDDVFFVNDSLGFVAGGIRGAISSSRDGGVSWTDDTSFVAGTYLRSIEFLDDSVGFCGSLDTAFYRTIDGGKTWTDVSSTINPIPKGVCGLSSPNDSTIYGCGIYNEPAFIIKSTDRGNTWTYLDMSAYAKALVEVHFISSDTGFVAGRANPLSDGGVILYTTDGGITWTRIFQTQRNLDYIWKIQSPDQKNYFAAVSSVPNSGNTTFLKSIDKGLTWTQHVVDTAWYDIQMIGFIDSLKGWTGGGSDLFETFDGGSTWNKTTTAIPGGSFFNRFLKLNDSTAMISGQQLYRYTTSPLPTFTAVPTKKRTEVHQIRVQSNPTHLLQFQVEIGNSTHATIQLINISGNVLETYHHGAIPKGTYSFRSEQGYGRQTLFLIMRTNEGLYTKKVIVE